MTQFCGYIALLGQPNVGKSTLLNYIIEQKISITSRKPQTTRHRILGIRTEENVQYIYVDTPGVHQHYKRKVNHLMNKAALSTISDVDVIGFMVEALRWQEEDEYVLQAIQNSKTPCILIINKVDKVADKAKLLPWIEMLQHKHPFAAIVPISAQKGWQVDVLHASFKPYLPEGPHLFPEDYITDKPVRFLCAEQIREKIFRLCGQELPYSTSVHIEKFEEEENLVRIHALILVDKENHKRMIIGDQGQKLKHIATQARVDMEILLGKKVFLQCWCKIKAGWADDLSLLKQLGYDASL
ncbi:MAG: GTPase Era [Legionellaceae bacterium]|nr:GTPase Era [Legionellaceae bacterium]